MILSYFKLFIKRKLYIFWKISTKNGKNDAKKGTYKEHQEDKEREV